MKAVHHIVSARVVLGLVLGLLLVACEPGSGEGLDENGNPISNVASIPLDDNFPSIQANIFTPNCAVSGCHNSANPAPPEGLVLGPAASFFNIVGVPSNKPGVALNLIEPGNPNNSFLLQKVEGTQLAGQQMPLNLPPLSTQEMDVLRSWVQKGAFVFDPTMQAIQANIFTPICTQCHFGTSPAGSLNLEDGQSFANLVGVQRPFDPEFRVVEFDANSSFLIDKLEGNNLGGSRGSRMPLNGPFLDQVEIDVIRAWIDAGALDN